MGSVSFGIILDFFQSISLTLKDLHNACFTSGRGKEWSIWDGEYLVLEFETETLRLKQFPSTHSQRYVKSESDPETDKAP